MAVDRHWRCYVSPAFVDRTPVEELAGVWVHEVSHLLRDHHGRSDRVARARGLTGPAERLRMNIAADCEINDDAFGDGLARPEGAVAPGSSWACPTGELMEDYLRRFRLGPHTQGLAWLDCGSGADGREREWELGPDGAHGLSAQERDAVRFRVAAGHQRPPGQRARRVAAVGGGGVPSAAAVAGVAGRGGPLGGLRARRGRGLHLRPAVAALGRPARRRAAEPAAQAAAGLRGHRHLRVGQRRRTGQRAAGGRRDLPRRGRPARPGHACCRATRRPEVVHPLCRAEGIPLLGGGGTDLRDGLRQGAAGPPRPDVVVALTDGQTPWPGARPPCRTVVGLFPRSPRSYDEDDPDYVPGSPPAWARVVEIG